MAKTHNNQNHHWVYLFPDLQELSTNSSFYIKVPLFYYERLSEQTITIKYGDQQKVAILQRTEDIDKNVFYCSHQLLDSLLGSTSNYPFYSALFCIATQTVTLGPVLGVLTEISKPSTDTIENLFPKIRSFCEEITEYSKDMGTFCHVYSLQSLTDEYDFGYTYQNKQWRKLEIPQPHFLYNRIHSRKMSYSKAFLRFCDELTSKYISIFNRSYFSKQDMYECLLPSTLASYIPEGRPCEKQDFFQMIRKYPILFAKPVYGSKGKGIIRIQRDGSILTFENQDHTKHEASTLKDAWSILQLYTNQRPYWFQEGISLITFENQTVDFRVVTHLAPDGGWKATSTTARLSEEGGFITNLAQGGKKISATLLLQSLFGKSRGTSIFKIIEELAIVTSRLIADKRQDSFIELGIDIAVSQTGRVYLLEVNAKPSKDDIENNTYIRPSAKKIVDISIAKGKINMEEGCLCKLSESSR